MDRTGIWTADCRHAALLLILSIVVMASCSEHAGKVAEQATYTTRTLKPEHRTLSTSYSATIRGRQDVDVYAQITGKIVKVCVGEGEKVKKGQPLFIIDPIPFETALETSRAAVHTAEARLSTAELEYRGKEDKGRFRRGLADRRERSCRSQGGGGTAPL